MTAPNDTSQIEALAEGTFGSADKAARWLNRPLRALDGRTPMQVAQTEAGTRVVAAILARIAWGAAA